MVYREGEWQVVGGLVLSALLSVACGGRVGLSGGGDGDGDEPFDPGSDLQAARARFERFDFEAMCTGQDALVLDRPLTERGYQTAMLQRGSGRGTLAGCLDMTNQVERDACTRAFYDCLDAPYSNLERVQWPAQAMVVEIQGLQPERVNPGPSDLYTYATSPSGDPETFWLRGFYHLAATFERPEIVPGANACSYWWYLDATENGVALVVSADMTAFINGGLAQTKLSLCLTD